MLQDGARPPTGQATVYVPLPLCHVTVGWFAIKIKTTKTWRPCALWEVRAGRMGW